MGVGFLHFYCPITPSCSLVITAFSVYTGVELGIFARGSFVNSNFSRSNFIQFFKFLLLTGPKNCPPYGPWALYSYSFVPNYPWPIGYMAPWNFFGGQTQEIKIGSRNPINFFVSIFQNGIPPPRRLLLRLQQIFGKKL